MFGVNSAVHAASRSAQTSFGAVRDNAAVCLSSVGSTLHCCNLAMRIPSPSSPLFPSILANWGSIVRKPRPGKNES